MNEPFFLLVTYQGKEYELKARFERWGYTHRIAVLVGETTFFFEPDEEGGYRALISNERPVADGTVSLSLLALVAEKLKALTG